MSTELKKLTVDASNGSFTFEVVDAEARAKADAAKTVADGIKLPTALPNPKKLTFTGGATGTYDGSRDVTIVIPTGGTGQNPTGGGMSATASALLINILRNGVYSTDQSANITALEAILASGGGSVEPDIPEPPVSEVEQNGTILSIVSGVTVSQTGSVLAIA